jgi:hypothetical protein
MTVAKKAKLCRDTVVALTLSGMLSTNCFSASHYKSGDNNYPRMNPAPAQYIEMSARIDPTLPIEFDAVFSANSENCVHQPLGSALEGAGEFPYETNFPIAMKRQGDHFEGRVAMDVVLPGSCDWRFAGIIARAHGEDVFHGKLVIQGQWVVELGGAGGALNPSLKATCELTGPRFGKDGVELSCFSGLPWAWISPQTNSLKIEVLASPKRAN